MLNSYGSRKATLKPQQSKQYPSSSSASKSGSFRLPSFLSTLPAIFGTNDESLNKQQFHQKDQQVDLGGYRGGGSSAAVDRDYYNYDRNNQEKNTTFALSEAQRRNLKGIYKTNNNNVAGNSNYNTTAVDGRKHSQNHVTGNNTRSNQPTSTATLQKPNNPSNNNNYKSMYPPGGAPSSNNLFPVKENSKSHLEPNKPNLPLQSQAETQAYIRGRYSTSTTTSKSSDQTTSSTASSSSVNNNTPSSSMFPSSLFPSVATSKEKDRESKTSSSAPPAPASGAKVVCDKCDGKHPTDSCPYYKKPREDHPDAQKGKQMGGTSLLPGSFLSSARVVRQPGDGSCLFHSMSYGYGQGYNATRLRSEICAFIAQNPDLKISDTPMKDWIRWDSNSTVLDYSRRMSRGGWGGGIEMAAFSQMKQVNVHVYERHGMGYKRISAFDYHISPETKPVIRVLYGGGVHYDALVA